MVLADDVITYSTRHFPSKSIAGASWRVDSYGGNYVCNCPGVRASKTGICEHIRAAIAADKEGNDMTNAVAIRDNTPQELQAIPMATPSFLPSEPQLNMMKTIAALAVDGNETNPAIPAWIKTPNQAMVLMLTGAEMGFTPFAALRQLFAVNGRVELFTQGLISLVRARDKTAQFVFTRYDNTGCTVELFRGGKSAMGVPVTYDASDRELSKQGYTKRGQWKETANKRRYFDAAKDANGNIIYDPDPESPWGKYPRDMYAYNAIKRCVRLGAPDLINIAPFYYAELDTGFDESKVVEIDAQVKEAPRTQLAAAVDRGEVKPADVVSDEPVDAEAPAPQGSTQPDQSGDNAPASDADVAALEQLMVKTRQEYGADYVPWFRSFTRAYMPGAKDWIAGKPKLTVSAVRAGLAELRGIRGEVAPEVLENMTNERDETQSEPPAEKEPEGEQPVGEQPEGQAETDEVKGSPDGAPADQTGSPA